MVSIWKLLLPLGVDLLPFKICNACGCFCLLAVWLSFSFCLSLLFFSLPTIHKPPFPLPTGPITPVFFFFFLLFYPDFNIYFLFHLLTHKYTLTHTHNKVKTWSAMTVQQQGLITCPQRSMRFCGRTRLRICLHLLLSNRTMKTSSWNQSKQRRRTQLKKKEFCGQRHCLRVSLVFELFKFRTMLTTVVRSWYFAVALQEILLLT